MTIPTEESSAVSGRTPALGIVVRLWRAVVLVLALSGCEGLLDVDDPDVITASDLEGETGINVIHAGAVGDFAYAWTGGAGAYGQVLAAGILSDEWMESGGFLEEADKRDVAKDGFITGYVFDHLHRARRAAEVGAETIAEASIDTLSEPRIAELYALAGFTYVAFGENYCSGVPFSTAPEEGDLQFGEPQTTSEIFEIAIQRFDQALANAGGDETMANLAAVGKARSLLNLERFEDASAEVAAVPSDFKYVTEHSSNSVREWNAVYWMNVPGERHSLSDNEGGTGLPFRSADDPRVPWTRAEGGTDVGRDGSTPQYDLLKYADESAPLVLADGIEARLIEAEALLRSGSAAGWLGILNQLRADGGMAALADPGDDDARVDLHFSERAFWMFATGHRLGDMRRLVRQYGRAADSVFPTGDYHRGGVYGADVNLPIPIAEAHNPNFERCLNREP
jgi:hypothetical protein